MSVTLVYEYTVCTVYASQSIFKTKIKEYQDRGNWVTTFYSVLPRIMLNGVKLGRSKHKYRPPVSKEFFPLVRTGDVHALHLLLHSDRNWLGDKLLSLRDGFNNTALIAAASKGNSAMVSYLLNRSSDEDGLNATNSQGMTALHWAARENHAHICDQLLQKGADYNMRTRRGERPIDFALKMGNEEAVSCLLLWGCPFPFSPLWGLHGVSCIEQERNLIVAQNGTCDKDILREKMKKLFDTRIAPVLFVE